MITLKDNNVYMKKSKSYVLNIQIVNETYVPPPPPPPPPPTPPSPPPLAPNNTETNTTTIILEFIILKVDKKGNALIQLSDYIDLIFLGKLNSEIFKLEVIGSLGSSSDVTDW